MRDHVRLLGILNIVMGCLVALIGVVIFVILGGAAGAISTQQIPTDTQAALPIIALVGVCVGVFFLVLAAPSIIGGWGLLKFRPWARILVIIVSIFHLFSFPFGTALGVYGLWVLLSEEGRRIFEGPAYQGYVPLPPYPAQTPPPNPAATYPPQPPTGV